MRKAAKSAENAWPSSPGLKHSVRMIEWRRSQAYARCGHHVTYARCRTLARPHRRPRVYCIATKPMVKLHRLASTHHACRLHCRPGVVMFEFEGRLGRVCRTPTAQSSAWSSRRPNHSPQPDRGTQCPRQALGGADSVDAPLRFRHWGYAASRTEGHDAAEWPPPLNQWHRRCTKSKASRLGEGRECALVSPSLCHR